MDAEIEGYSGKIRSLLDRIRASVDGLTEAQLNRRPPLDGANSPYVIAAHTLGNARAWVLGIACGQAVERDRPAEFVASGRAADLLAAARQLSGEIEAALAVLSLSDLERRLVPAKSLWGEGEPHEISVRQALLEVVEHASIHLGQLHITCDLARREIAA
ncbi:MAG: DinB family protein [Chloroflexi bacterium]|nr:DinB family protein [Chloroflexota bacterium]